MFGIIPVKTRSIPEEKPNSCNIPTNTCNNGLHYSRERALWSLHLLALRVLIPRVCRLARIGSQASLDAGSRLFASTPIRTRTSLGRSALHRESVRLSWRNENGFPPATVKEEKRRPQMELLEEERTGWITKSRESKKWDRWWTPRQEGGNSYTRRFSLIVLDSISLVE